MNRSQPMSRTGFQGMASSSVPNSSSMVGMANLVVMHSGASSAQANSVLRPREALQKIKIILSSLLDGGNKPSLCEKPNFSREWKGQHVGSAEPVFRSFLFKWFDGSSKPRNGRSGSDYAGATEATSRSRTRDVKANAAYSFTI